MSPWVLSKQVSKHSKLRTEDLANILTLKVKNVQKWPKDLFAAPKILVKNFFFDFSSYISIFKKKSTSEQVLQGRPSWHGSYTYWVGYPDLVLLNQLPVEDYVF